MLPVQLETTALLTCLVNPPTSNRSVSCQSVPPGSDQPCPLWLCPTSVLQAGLVSWGMLPARLPHDLQLHPEMVP